LIERIIHEEENKERSKKNPDNGDKKGRKRLYL